MNRAPGPHTIALDLPFFECPGPPSLELAPVRRQLQSAAHRVNPGLTVGTLPGQALPGPATPQLVKSSADEEPVLIDRRYRLNRRIARGGGGIVFEADHVVTGRRVALKLVPAGDPGRAEKGARLLREARALVQARHPSIVEVLDAGTDEARVPYLVMELLEGRTLRGILASRRTLPPLEVAALGWSLCQALDHAHRHGIVHRDIKPGNIIITRDPAGNEQVKVIDFGIAQLSAGGQDEEKITTVGAILGTPEYLAPEQLMGKECDGRADVYGLGVVLFECLTGNVPFEGSFGEIVLKASTTSPPRASSCNPSVPAALDAIVARAIKNDPAARYSSMRELGAALAAQVPPRHPLRVLAGQRLPPTSPSRPLDQQSAPAEAISRRRFPRAPYVTPIRVVLPDGTKLDGRTEDISEGGLLALVSQPCHDGLPVHVRFALPVTGRIVTVEAVSRWVKVARYGAAAGLEFCELSSEHRATIRNYVQLMHGQ